MLRTSIVSLALCYLALCQIPAIAQNITPAQRASKQMQSKNFNEALSSLTEAIADDDHDPMLYFRRAQCFYCLDRVKDALEDFDHAIKLDSGVAQFFLWRGTAQAKLGDDEAAINDYQRALRLDVDLLISYNEAQAKNKAKDTAPVDAAVKSSENSSPDQALKNSETGDKHEDTPMTGSATTAPVDAKPSGATATTTTATTTTTGTTTATTTASTTAATSAPPTAATKHTIDLGYNARAVADYAAAVKRASVRSVAYFRAGTVFSGLCELDLTGKPMGSLLDCSSDGTISKKDNVDYFSIKDTSKNLRQAEDLITENPSSGKGYYERGRVYEQQGKFDLAAADLTRAVELEKKNASYYLARAFFYHQQEDKAAAREDLRAALDLDPNLPRITAFDPPKIKQVEIKPTSDKPDEKK